MINLIPIEKRKMMQKAFYQRFATILLIGLGLAFIAGAIALLPAYFSASVKLSVAKNSLLKERADALSAEEQKVLGTIQNLEVKLGLAHNKSGERYLVSERIIDSVISRKTSDIKIRKIRYTGLTDKKVVLIEGNAQSRESLLNFRVALEKDTSWAKVELPVSNFVRGSDIDFTLTLTPRTE